MEKQNRIRLDQFLHQEGLATSRTKAQELIKRGEIMVDGRVVRQASYLITAGQQVTKIAELPYVSRGGDKLQEANAIFGFDFRDKVVLDIGASTGGFTDYALKAGAKLVYALDVGHGQLAPVLKGDMRVVNMEGVHLKTIPELQFSDHIDIILCDVSFIGLAHVFPAIDSLVQRDHPVLFFLIKPQFEWKRVKPTSKNIKKFWGKVPPEFLNAIVQDLIEEIQGAGYQLQQLIPLVNIRGKKLGNQEFFGVFSKI